MKVLITGGAGFIGSNLAYDYAKNCHEVVIFDNLSRNGTELNMEWLTQNNDNIVLFNGDIRIKTDIKECFDMHGKFDIIFHLAAQVAVTTSVTNPQEDFEINAFGSFNLLEVIRMKNDKAIVLYTSTNKVYGGMENIEIIEKDGRYIYKDYPNGISENECLDFHSPYGCSKGAADQYFIDYSRIYGLKTIVFRQSCIYGYRQFGIEDQGWVAWFTIASIYDKDISIFGDGMQVRDVLFIDDLIEAYKMSIANIEITSGQAYNIGGGYFNMSLLELLSYLEDFFDKKINYKFDDWRPGDQKVFIADISKAKNDFGWEPKIGAKDGVKKLASWVEENKKIFKEVGII